MTMLGFLSAAEHTSLAAAMRGEIGGEWLFPIVETLHVISLAMVFGSIVMVDLRLVGATSRNSAVSRLSGEVLPYTWGAFICAIVTGTLLFISKAHVYFYNLQFQLKFLCMLLAGMNMAVFHFGTYRRVLEWDDRHPPPRAARLAGALSIALWIGVIFFGRWIGFTT
ncbi:MAG: hypothetical protein QOI88_521 [Gammaproteobacteria bacterium]|nr:hypothetical protein [Gammaproteobacteria bacterium]